MQVYFDDEQNLLSFVTVPLYEAAEGDTLKSVSKLMDISPALLKELNQLRENELVPGQQLKTVVPDLMKSPGNKEDLFLLAKIIYIEAGDEPFAGQVAIGEVVLNRVKDPRFPDTLEAVIYQPGQFPPAAGGKLDEVVPSDEAILAAHRALAGESYAPGALYFYNPQRQDKDLSRYEVVAEIGSHCFIKDK